MKFLVILWTFLAAATQISAQDNVTCTVESELRLLDSDTLTRSNAGRLEICKNGVWGTIKGTSSNSFWSEKNILVACRALGFSVGLNAIPSNQVISGLLSEVPVHYSNVVCSGTEKNFSDCQSVELINDNDHSTDVNIVCLPVGNEYADLYNRGNGLGEVRLVGSTENGRGVIEILADIGWSTICPDSSWERSDATAICRNLGYESGEHEIITLDPSRVNPRRMIDVECMDRSQVPARVPITRNSAGDCNFLASSNCALPETSFAGVRCSTRSPTGSVRLIGKELLSPTRYQGIVEILYDNRWGVLCKPSVASAAATICEGFGYGRDDSSFLSMSVSRYESRFKPLWIPNVFCPQGSNHLQDCIYERPLGYGNCEQILVVDCGERPKPLPTGTRVGIAVGVIIAILAITFGVGCTKGKEFWRVRHQHEWYNTLTTPKKWCQCCPHCDCTCPCHSVTPATANVRTVSITTDPPASSTRGTTTTTEELEASSLSPRQETKPEDPELVVDPPPPYDAATNLPTPKKGSKGSEYPPVYSRENNLPYPPIEGDPAYPPVPPPPAGWNPT